MDDLKPCPFCGSPAKLMGGPYSQETYSVWCTRQRGKRHHIDCGYNEAAAIREWNTRAVIEIKKTIRPLVWVEEVGDGYVIARAQCDALGAEYTSGTDANGDTYWTKNGRPFVEVDTIGEHATMLDAAKAACLDDHASRALALVRDLSEVFG